MNDSSVRTASPVLRSSQRNMVPTFVLAFITVFLIAQLWILTQAIEGVLQGETSTMLPAVIGSGLCFLGAWRLWRAVWDNA